MVELIISLGAATVILLGLMSTLAISSQAWDPALKPIQQLEARQAIRQIINDIRFARSFTERTATAITIQVPDRDNDQFPETIRYAWSGNVGDPLTVDYNSQGAQTLVENIQELDFTHYTRAVTAN